MGKVARNEFDAEECRLQIAGILKTAGPDANAVEVWRIINEGRHALARDAALAAGRGPDAAEAAGRAARIGIHAIRRDIRILVGRVQRASAGGIAVFLQDQMDAVEDEIEATHLMDEQITSDLERSRQVSWTRARLARRRVGEAVAGQPEKFVVEPADSVRYQLEDGPGVAALWGRLQASMARRAELRKEQRSLRFSMLAAPEPDLEGEEAEEATMVTAVSGISDPATARDVVLRRLSREIRELDAAARLPATAELTALDRMRAEALHRRLTNIRNLREYLEDAERETGGTFEVSFTRAEPRQLPPAPVEEKSG